ncbi:hypothetical protein A2U01_0077679, partial [Trifolium medium]|nr:hypothetical protein [Trifolium medium]
VVAAARVQQALPSQSYAAASSAVVAPALFGVADGPARRTHHRNLILAPGEISYEIQ